MERTWQQALRKTINGVYILTTFHKEKINGMIISWVSQISYEPPLIMVAIHPNRYSHHLVEQSGHFALNILARSQVGLLEYFKGAAPNSKFESIQWNKGKTGCPLLLDCIACIECKVVEILKPGNHTLFLGEIMEAQLFSSDEPMSTLNYSGTYIGKN